MKSFPNISNQKAKMQTIIICDETEPAKTAKLCKTNNYGIEIQSFYDPDYITRTPDAINYHQTVLGNISPRSFHGPFGDLFPGSFDTMVRDLARYRCLGAASIASRLGATHLVLHHGYTPKTSLPSMWLKRSIQFWSRFLEEIPDSISIHLENHLEQDASLQSDLISAVDNKRLDVCLDIGHAHCCSEQTPVQWIEKLRDKIGYVHLHDNHGQKDEHLALGEGNIPMVDVCEALKAHAPNAIWAIETAPDSVAPSLAWLRNHSFID